MGKLRKGDFVKLYKRDLISEITHWCVVVGRDTKNKDVVYVKILHVCVRNSTCLHRIGEVMHIAEHELEKVDHLPIEVLERELKKGGR